MKGRILMAIIATIFLAPTPAAESALGADQTLARHAEVLRLWVTIFPRKRTMDLVQVFLHAQELLMEPSVLGPKGKPSSANVQISNQQSLALIETLDRLGFFKRAGTLHESGRNPQKPPFNGAARCGSPTNSKSTDPGFELKLYGLDEYWCANYSTTQGTFKEGRELLREFMKTLDGKAAELLSDLDGQLG